MLAHRTDEICRKFLSFVDVAADRADPALALRFCRSRLDVLVVIGICRRRSISDRESIRKVCDEHDVGAKIDFLCHLGAENGIDPFSDVDDTILKTVELDAEGLVDIPAALETPVLENFE